MADLVTLGNALERTRTYLEATENQLNEYGKLQLKVVRFLVANLEHFKKAFLSLNRGQQEKLSLSLSKINSLMSKTNSKTSHMETKAVQMCINSLEKSIECFKERNFPFGEPKVDEMRARLNELKATFEELVQKISK
jgi:hypothetical protein